MSDFVTITLPSDGLGTYDIDVFAQLLSEAEFSADGKRVVVLGHVAPELLTEIADRENGKVKRPYAVFAVREDGVQRTWLVSSRDAARSLKRKYQENNGSAKIQDTRK